MPILNSLHVATSLDKDKKKISSPHEDQKFLKKNKKKTVTNKQTKQVIRTEIKPCKLLLLSPALQIITPCTNRKLISTARTPWELSSWRGLTSSYFRPGGRTFRRDSEERRLADTEPTR